MAKIQMEPTLKMVSVWNKSLSILNAFDETPFFSSKVMATTTALRIKKTTPMRFKKGRAGIKNLIPRESGIVRIAAQTAELAVAFFQNNPKMKIAKIPGLTNPVNS